ncbi:MAG: DNA adenine methylase [Lachnospiraceae bacterium]
MDSFISWVGGKKLLRNKILGLFPGKQEFNRYVEVFGGAGWVLFSSDRHAETEVYNDMDGRLVNLFRCVKYHPDALQKELEFTLNSREQFFDARGQAEVRGMTDIQRAARFYILIKESFGTDLRSFGMRTKDMGRAVKYLEKVSERLRSVVIEHQDFEKVIKNHDRETTLFYLDPPYYGTESYYAEKFQEEDYGRLKSLLDGIKGKFILSYNDCSQIRELYKDYDITKADRMHNLVRGGKTKPRYKELLIKNF